RRGATRRGGTVTCPLSHGIFMPGWVVSCDPMRPAMVRLPPRTVERKSILHYQLGNRHLIGLAITVFPGETYIPAVAHWLSVSAGSAPIGHTAGTAGRLALLPDPGADGRSLSTAA